MSPRCVAMIPAQAGQINPRRCHGRAVRRVDGAVVCVGHVEPAKEPGFERYKRWAVPTSTGPERASKLTRFSPRGSASAEFFVLAVAR